MAARGVYEAGFGDLRRHLHQGGDLMPLERDVRPAVLAAGLSMPTRRSVVRHYGAAEVLVADDVQANLPGDGEMRIRQRAIGVNCLDIYLRCGWMPSMFPVASSAPGVPGMEAAGSVIDTGANAAGLLPGYRVAYLGPVPGAWCEVRCVPAEGVVRLPAAIEDETAAALLMKGITADYLRRDLGHIGPGTRLRVHAAAGGVGPLVCARARRLGAVLLGTVSSEAKARIAREHGCEHVIVTRDDRFADAVQRACSGADVVIDGLGDAARDENLAALARRGHRISLGPASGPLAPLPPDALLAKSLTFSRPVVFDYVATNAALAERAQRVWTALADGTLRAPLIERQSLAAAATAHARLESRATIGALILVP